MSEYKKLSHVIYRFDYHIVWTPKYRFRVLEGLIKQQLSEDILMLLEWKGCEKKELNIQKDHIHLIVSCPPKQFISSFMGTLKGKTAIKLFENYPRFKKKPYWGNDFWARVYCVDTVGFDKEKIRKYVKYQEDNEKKEEQQGSNINPFEG